MVNYELRALALSILLRMTLVFAAFAGVLYLTAGRALPMFWAYLALFYAIGVVGLAMLARRDPSLMVERFRPTERGKDRITRAAALVLLSAHLVLAGLDVGRFHWSDGVPLWTQLAGLLGVGLGLSGWMWAMAANRFFSSEVRIQRDRGHTVVTSGPYRFVRHPGYLAALILFISSPLALGSYIAALPMLVLVGVFLRRLVMEDRLLREELEGYGDYARRVPHRLVPGVW